MSTQNNESKHNAVRKPRQRIFEMVLFAMLGALMFCSKLLMELLPNIHLVGMLVVVLTVVYRVKALIPIYIYVALSGLYAAFHPWWFPYLYVWTVLWAMTMLVPKRIPKGAAVVIYPLLCSLHGFAFGTLYAPAQALMYKLSFEGMLAWIVAGFPYDIIHGISNLAAGALIFPLSELLKKLMKQHSR